MCKQLLDCLQLGKCSPFSKINKRFYRCRSIPLFLPTFMMILNQMMDILWQTAAAVANGIKRSASSFKLKIFEIRNTTCYMLRTYVWRNKTFSKTWLKKYFFSPFTTVYVKLQLFCEFLSSQKFPIL